MQRKKGGLVTWAHYWQQDLVGTIYRVVRCKTLDEFEECKLWLRDFINLFREFDGGTIRDLLQTFFQLKIDIAERWVKAFRMGKGHLDIISSSRIEGEFSWLWLLRLTSASTLCKSVVKMRWAAHCRHHKKQKSIEDWFSTALKRTCPPGFKASDWTWLDKVMTPHHMKIIVTKIQAASDYALQLTALTPEVMEFAVWRVKYVDDPCESVQRTSRRRW
jgi:hypothetical protein